MITGRRRAFLVAGAMAAAAGLAAYAKPTVHLADLVGKPSLDLLFPAVLGEWRVDTSLPVILPSPDVQAKLNAIYNQTLARTYVNNRGQRIMLSVAYGGDQSDGTRAHRPEVCYPVQGFQITHNREERVSVGGNTLPVRRLMSRMQSRHEPITYWLVVGGQAVTSGAQQKLIELRHGLRGLIADGLLVRVSSIDPDMGRAYDIHDSFLRDLARNLDEPSLRRVFGGGLFPED